MPPPRPTPRRSERQALQTFRGAPRATVALHPLETTLVVITGLLLCFMPWAFGTMHVWSQWISLGLASLAFGVALIKRRYRGELAPQGEFRLVMWRKLLRFPLFWLGLLLLAYILTQALNPAWMYVRDGRSWWLNPLDSIPWLPAGMDTPYNDMSPWRVLVIYATPWLLVSALWVGITRRLAVQALFTVVAVNGAVLALIGILQKVTAAPTILWVSNATNTSYFFSTLIYKNHAGAYFNLVLMLCAGLLCWHFSRAERRLERASPAPLFAFIAVLLGLSVLLTNSRASIILLLVFVLIAFTGFLIRCTLYKSEGRSPWVLGVLGVIFALFLGCASYFLNANQAFGRVGKLLQDGSADNSVMTRNLTREATWDMARDHLLTGWGAGSFRHYFPVYQRHYPAIYNVPGSPTVKMRWEYAHNDYVQLLAELGLIGAGLLFTMLVTSLGHLVRHRIWLRPHLLFITLALAVTAVHAWMDFQFHNPAILVLWCASAALLGRWAEVENRRA